MILMVSLVGMMLYKTTCVEQLTAALFLPHGINPDSF